MKIIFSLTAVLCTSLSLIAQDEKTKMPPDAQDMATKLIEWELSEKESYENRVKEKREQVASALQTHLDKATKSGDLDGAIAIRKYIASLSPSPTDQERDSAIPPGENPELDIMKKLLVNSTWVHNDGKTTVTIKRQIDECIIIGASGKEIEGMIVIKDGLISFESERLWFRNLLPNEDGTELVGKYQTMTRK